MGIQLSELRQLAVLAVLFYESRVRSVDRMAGLIRAGLENLTLARNCINENLREYLCATESMRRRDFNCLIKKVFASQDLRQQHIGLLFKTYLEKQTEAAAFIKKILSGEEPGGPAKLEKIILQVHLSHREREMEICELLKDFQNEQADCMRALHRLLNKPGRKLPEFREMLKNMVLKQQTGIEEVKAITGKIQNTAAGFQLAEARC
ncbi:MAG: hypothetical protein M0Z52_12805 [Actinomycetota bacterium]|nr:hypothetical protein [Actinomycetota bacterium]